METVTYSGSKKSLMLAACILLMITATAASYSCNVVLPSLLTERDAMGYYSVYAAVASMGMMSALPLVGSLSSKFGAKTVLLVGMVTQFILRLLLLMTGNLVLFGVLYALQGFFGGLYMPSPFAIIAEVVKPEERPRWFGILAAASALGALAGPLLAGQMADRVSAGVGLEIYLVFAIIPFLVFLAIYPNSKRPMGKFDFGGIACLFVFVVCLVMWLSLGGKLFKFASPIGIALPIVIVISLILLISRERKAENPAVPVAMFAKKRFRNTFMIQCLVVSYATCIGAYGIVYAIQVMGLSSTVSSTVTMPQTIVQFILGLFIGSLIGKAFKKRFRFFGLLAIVAYLVGLVIFYTLTPDTSITMIYLATGIGGIGQAIAQSQYSAFFQTELKMEEIRPAQGMYQFSQTGGSSIFMALCGACMNLGMSYNQVFLLGAAFCGVALILGLIGFRFPKEEINAEVAQIAAATSSKG